MAPKFQVVTACFSSIRPNSSSSNLNPIKLLFQIIKFEIISGNKIPSTILKQVFQRLRFNTAPNEKNEQADPKNFLKKGYYFSPKIKPFSIRP
jgi:hypothetical protein